jgi:hypothetical protein
VKVRAPNKIPPPSVRDIPAVVLGYPVKALGEDFMSKNFEIAYVSGQTQQKLEADHKKLYQKSHHFQPVCSTDAAQQGLEIDTDLYGHLGAYFPINGLGIFRQD